MTTCDRLRTVTVEPVLFLFMFSTFMQYVSFQDLIYEKVCASTFNSSVCGDLYAPGNDKSLSTVQGDSSMWILFSTLALTLLSIVSSYLLGLWGDSFGRRLPLLMPSVGGALSSVVYIWMSCDNLNGPIWPILVASSVSGIFGGFAGCIMAVISYIASESTHANRTSRIAVLEAMSFLGGTAGPFAGGALLKQMGHAAVFTVIGVCHIVIVVYVLTRFTETHIDSDFSERRHVNVSCGLSHIKTSLMTFFKKRDDNVKWAMMSYLVCMIIIMTAIAGEMDVAYLYARDMALRWDRTMYSYYFGFKYALGSIVLLLGPLLLKCLKFEDCDLAICLIGIISKFAGFLLMGYSSTTTLMFLVPVLSLFGPGCVATLRSLLSKQVESDEQGKMFAFVASVENVCTLLGSVIFNSLYPVMRTVYTGFVFHFAAAMHIIPLIIIVHMMLWEKRVYAALNGTS